MTMSRQSDPAALGPEARRVAAQLSERSVAPAFLGVLVQLFETVSLVLIGIGLSYAIFPHVYSHGWGRYSVIFFAPVVSLFLIRSSGGYSVPALRDPISTLARMLFAWTAVVLFCAASGFFSGLGNQQSPTWLALLFVCGTLFLVLERAILATIVGRMTRAGRLEQRAVIVGGGPEAQTLIDTLTADRSTGIRLYGIFDDRGDERSPGMIAGLPKLGTIPELVAFTRLARIDLFVVSLPSSAEERLRQILKELWVLPVDIRLSALSSRLRFRPRNYSYIGAVPMLDLADRPIAGWNALLKRTFDLVFGITALILLSPFMLATAIAIRLDSPGPILFRQRRYGFNNEVIEVLKFRSMYHHLADPAAKKVVTRDDPRVTRVGRFIRRASIDELPQLFNVIDGKLSLVGPRPHAVNAHTGDRLWDEFVDGYFARHRVKPGITGWAQINGWRGEIDTPEKIMRRVECDLEYIDRWSVFLDFYILLLTPVSLLRGENAY